METDLDDIMKELSIMQLTMARVEERVQRLDKKTKQHTMSSGPEQSRGHPRIARGVLATAIVKLLKYSICHLMTRLPVTVTICCRQWLGSQDACCNAQLVGVPFAIGPGVTPSSQCAFGNLIISPK